MPGVEASTHLVAEWPVLAVAARAMQLRGDRIVLVGHSLGADAVLLMAATMDVPVEAVVIVDATRASIRVPRNIHNCSNVFNRMNPQGGDPTDATRWCRKIELKSLFNNHSRMIYGPEVSAEVLRRVRAAADPGVW